MSYNDDLANMVESKTIVLWYGRSELTGRALDDIGHMEADPEMLQQVEIMRDSHSWPARIRAWEKLREMGPSIRGWTRALRDLIFHADGWARIFAAESLACHACCEAEAVPVLLVTLESTLELHHYDWSRVACGAIGHYPTLPRPLTDQAVPAMMCALDASDINVQGYAAQALGKWGERAKPALVKLADLHDHADDPLRSHYLDVLQKIDPSIDSAHQARLRALEDEDEKVRAGAIASLGRSGPMAAEALPELLTLAADDSPEVRRNLALTLGNLQVAEHDVLHRLGSLLSDSHPVVQMAAAYAFVRLEFEAKENLSRLRRGLASQVEACRYLAAWSLGEVGYKTPWRSTSALKKARRTEAAETVRDAIDTALRKLENR